MPNTITPTALKTSEIYNLVSNRTSLLVALTAPEDTEPPSQATMDSTRQALLDELDRRVPIPAP